jgi:8-oxo-dGTP pyrophosphatase MutT (NUDIX family)
MKTENKLDPRLHFVVATAIVVKKGKFLLVKRAAHEKAFPNKWTVPGGKLVAHEYGQLPYKTKYPQWYNVIDWVLKKEVKEEANVEIKKPNYLCDLVFVRPDGYPVATLSYWAHYKSGVAKPGKDLTDHAWVTLKEAKKYDLIDGIWDELKEVDKIIKKI